MLSLYAQHFTFAPSVGEMAEWSNAAVLKTVDGQTSGGSNPSLSANQMPGVSRAFLFSDESKHLVLE